MGGNQGDKYDANYGEGKEDQDRLGPPTPTSDTWKSFRWQLDCVSLPGTLWEKLDKGHFQKRHLVSVTSGNTYVEAPDSGG